MPAVAVFASSAYIGLKAPTKPDIKFGANFVLGPAYWSGGGYYHNPIVKKVLIRGELDKKEPLRLRIRSVSGSFRVLYRITLVNPTSRKIVAKVPQKATATTDILVDQDKIEAKEGFKIVQFSSIFIDDYYNDAHTLVYFEDGVKKKVGLENKDGFIFAEPALLSKNVVKLFGTNSSTWEGRKPDAIVSLRGQRSTYLQGWVEKTDNKNNDNLGIWFHPSQSPPTIQEGDTFKSKYLFTGQLKD